MAFIDNAKEVLTSEEFAKLELLNKKSADFDTTSDEDVELMGLKKKVKETIAQRDKEKNLAFIKEYTLMEILSVFKPTKEDWNTATSALFPKEKAVVTDGIATYKIGDNSEDFKIGERASTELSKAIKAGGEKVFVKNLSDFGKTWIAKFNKPTIGKYKDQVIYNNVSLLVTRFKFKKETLIKELQNAGLIEKDKK